MRPLLQGTSVARAKCMSGVEGERGTPEGSLPLFLSLALGTIRLGLAADRAGQAPCSLLSHSMYPIREKKSPQLYPNYGVPTWDRQLKCSHNLKYFVPATKRMMTSNVRKVQWSSESVHLGNSWGRVSVGSSWIIPEEGCGGWKPYI